MYSGYPVQTIRLDFSTAATTTAWRTLSSSLTYHVKVAELYNSSTSFIELGIGAGTASATAIPMTVFPSGGNGRIDLQLSKSSNLFARVTSATASSGVLAINLFG